MRLLPVLKQDSDIQHVVVAYSDLYDLATQLDQGLTTASAHEGDLSAITKQLAAKDSELAELQQAKGEVEARAEYLDAETQRLTDEAEATKRQLEGQAVGRKDKPDHLHIERIVELEYEVSQLRHALRKAVDQRAKLELARNDSWGYGRHSVSTLFSPEFTIRNYDLFYHCICNIISWGKYEGITKLITLVSFNNIIT